MSALEGVLHFSIDLSPLKRTQEGTLKCPVAGWVFTSNGETGEYLVTLPTTVQCDVCQCCSVTNASRLSVRIDRYIILPFVTELDPPSLRGVLEVFSNGLRILTERTTIPPNIGDDELWTLEQLARKEALDAHLGDAFQRFGAPTSNVYTIEAAVAAVSPIIAIDPREPFCLVHVCQPPSYSSVILIKRSALAVQPAIVPFQTMRFRSVNQVSWQMLSEIEKVNYSQSKNTWLDVIPNGVFVVQDPKQIEWCAAAPSWGTPDISLDHQLVHLRGRIVHVSWIPMRVSEVTINYIIMVSSHCTANGSAMECRLYLANYPLSSTLLYSLRPGAVIESMNVHSLGLGYYAACLRSTLHVPAVAAEAETHDEPSIPWKIAQPLALYKKCRPYFSLHVSQIVREWLNECTDPDVPLADEWRRAISRCSHRSSCMSDVHRKTRHPYAEFFGHLSINDEAGSHGPIGCHLSCVTDLPTLYSLVRIQQVAFQHLRECLSNPFYHDEVGPLKSGRFASFSLTPSDLNERGYPLTSLLVGGRVTSVSNDGHSFCLADGRTTLPGLQCGEISSISLGAYVIARVREIVVSCFNLGSSSYTMGSPVSLLPFTQLTTHDAHDHTGACAVVKVGLVVYLASIFLRLGKIVALTNDLKLTSRNASKPFPSVRECLDCDMLGATNVSAFQSLLVRKHFGFFRAKDGQYKGFHVTLSHLSNGETPSEISTLQTMECKPTVKVDDNRHVESIIRQLLEISLGFVSEDQMGVSLAWWKISCSERHCALLTGGWDESNQRRNQGVVVTVLSKAIHRDASQGYVRLRCELDDLSVRIMSIPSDGDTPPCASSDENKVVCNRNEIRQELSQASNQGAFLDSFGGRKILPGILDRRPLRRRYEDVAHGELIDIVPANLSEPITGISVCSLADLHRARCQDLQVPNNLVACHLSPSLVWRVQGAKFLGISYCRVWPECSKCFASLVAGREINTTRNTHPKLGAQSIFPERGSVTEQPSFWQRSRPVPDHVSTEHESDEMPNGTIGEQRLRSLRENSCPSGTSGTIYNRDLPSQVKATHGRLTCSKLCDINNEEDDVSMKWECSGTLDDGTGQAKLYAERETAIQLLGLDRFEVEMIERGARCTPEGMMFVQSMPIPGHLRAQTIQCAVRKARELFRNEQRKQHPPTNRPLSTSNDTSTGSICSERDILRCMEPLLSAEYLFQRHCRYSPAPVRDRIYFVRCKPLHRDQCHLPHTTLDLIVSPGHRSRSVATYALPSLKLNLVDCGLSCHDPHHHFERVGIKRL